MSSSTVKDPIEIGKQCRQCGEVNLRTLQEVSIRYTLGVVSNTVSRSLQRLDPKLLEREAREI